MFTTVNTGKYELTVKKSIFIALSFVVDGKDEVKSISAELKKKYSDATHVCVGFISDEKGDEFGYDDDGEPSGTAGKPIYSAIEAADLRHTMIAVVRYFGGIKLGAGGLTRAYRQAASELITSVGISKRERFSEYKVECDTAAYKSVSSVLKSGGCTLDKIVFNDKVSFTARCPSPVDIEKLVIQFGVKAVKTGEVISETEE
ncbi:MAG: YigZ family protein [Clostridiales bacterium]|nr:YigZ family protein [Clostridiales bacterium]